MSEHQEPIREPQRLGDRFRRKRARMQSSGAAPTPFDQREVVCESREAAREEAARQQASEADLDAEWIYLKPEVAEHWVARRVPRHPERYEAKPAFLSSLLAALFSEPPPT